LLTRQGAHVVIADLPVSDGKSVAAQLGQQTRFVAADVTSEADMAAVFDAAESLGTLRAVVHCAGRGGPLRVVDKQGFPGSLEHFEAIIRVNLIGSFNVLRLGAARLAKTEMVDGERGVVILTASVAAFEGQIGQIPYASSKAGIVGMTIVAARDLAGRQIRVCTIAPGTFDTPILAKVSNEIRESLAKATPHPARLGRPSEFAMLAAQIIENPMLNGETIRLDGAIRMPPR
jgi:NAD(P)-dependent dehydrogenase (short-subunit alcohol dehydrogenase family)